MTSASKSCFPELQRPKAGGHETSLNVPKPNAIDLGVAGTPDTEQLMDKIVLVVPPWQLVTIPALGVSLLQANLHEHAVACEILYLNLHFADRIGLWAYHEISERTTTLLGDFLFSHLLFDRAPDATAKYIADVLDYDDLVHDHAAFSEIT